MESFRDSYNFSDPELLSTKLDDSVTEEYLNLLKLYAVDPGNEIALQKSGLVSLGEEIGLLGHTFELLHHSEDLAKLVEEVDVESIPRALGEKVHVDRRKVQIKAFDESIDEILSFANGLGERRNVHNVSSAVQRQGRRMAAV